MQNKLILDQAQVSEYRAITEAVLLASDTPLSLKELARILDDVEEEAIRECIEELNNIYKNSILKLYLLCGTKNF